MDYHPDRFFWATRLCFQFLLYFSVFGVVRYIKLALSSALGARKYTISNHIVVLVERQSWVITLKQRQMKTKAER